MINYAIQWCKNVGLDIQFCEKDEGLTDVSEANFNRFLPRIGPIVGIYLIYPPEDHPWGFWTVIVNRDSEAFIFSGFAWGYLGTGPRGLERVLKSIGWNTSPIGEVPAHESGVWSIDSYGNICRLFTL